MKAIIAGKALGILAGVFYLAKMIFGDLLFLNIIFTANIVLADTIIMLFMIYLTKKYFSNLPRE